MSASGEDDLDARDYLCYTLLEELEAAQPGRSITRTQFLKLTCIADRRLEEQHDLDIELPRYWYQYGEILNEKPISNSVYTETTGEWGGRKIQPSPGISRSSFYISPDISQAVYSVVHDVVGKFANDDAETIKDYQYQQYAPSGFIRRFDEFRSFLENQDEQNASLADFGSGSLQPPEEEAYELLDTLLAEYPVDLYSDMHRLFLRWEDTTRLLIEAGDFDTAENLLEDFWETFSKVELRHHHGQHTPESQEVRWLNEREDEIANLGTRLTEIREEQLSDRESNGILQTVAKTDLSEDAI